VLFETIECIEQNGNITGYVVETLLTGSVLATSDQMTVVDKITFSFTAAGLIPFTQYTFRVAGINEHGTGPYATISQRTIEDSKFLDNHSS